MIRKWWVAILATALAITLAGCGSTRMVQVPPRVDLAELGTVGLIDFSTPSGGGDLGARANRQFLTAILAAQPGVPVLELGDEEELLADVHGQGLGPETMRQIGERKQVGVVLHGVLETQEVRPKVSLGAGLESLNAKAEIQATLVARLYDTRTGATLWSRSVSERRTVASLSVSGSGVDNAGAKDPDEAKAELVSALVAAATSDFRPGWTRVKVED